MTANRYYPITLPDGRYVEYPRVTDILNVIDRRRLNDWRVEKGKAESEAILEETGAIGSQGHKIIERISNGEVIGGTEWFGLDERVRNGVRAWLRWRSEVGFIPKHTELLVYSEEFQYAGTLDVAGTRKPKIPILADYKLSGAIYEEGYFAQLVAYKKAYLEMYPKRRIDELWVVRLDKITGIPEARMVENEEKSWQIFLAALTIFKSRI